MNRSLARAGSRVHTVARTVLAGLLVVSVLATALIVPRAQAAIVQPTDVESTIALVTAVYNSLEDLFFRPVDSRDLLEAAWEGAERSVGQQRRGPTRVAPPILTGDRAGDLQAFLTQYRALLAAAGPDVDPVEVAMATSDWMTQSIGEQHTYFLPPEDFAQYTSNLTSESGRVGLGIVISGLAAPFRIAGVVEGAPADKAGVKQGDQIESVDGQDVRSLELDQLADVLRGGEGMPVRLGLRRGADDSQPGSGSVVEVTVVRARFSDPPLTMQVLPEGVCQFRLSAFPVAFAAGPSGRTIGEDFDYQLERCEQAGGKGWIVDLRGNGGGASVEQVLGRFMDAGPIMVEKDRAGNRYEGATDGHLFRVQRPLVVLIDGNSASASEVFSSAVQEYKRGVVMGQKSAGALNTTTIVPLPLGAGMGVAIRQVFTGLKEVVVDEVGVTPDVRLSVSSQNAQTPREAVEAALNPPAGVGPLPAGPNTREGLLSSEELKQRAEPMLIQAGDAAKPEDQIARGDLAYDTLHYYSGDYPSLIAARARALRLGWLGTYARWVGAEFPPPFWSTVSFYKDADGAHKDLQEIYEPGEPNNPPQWRNIEPLTVMGDETLARVGIGENEGLITIQWRRGPLVLSVSQSLSPGDPKDFTDLARLAGIVDQRAQANGR